MNYIAKTLEKIDCDSYIIELYSNLLLAFQNLNSFEHYKRYKKQLFKLLDFLSRDEISYHYSMLISYCILSNSISENKYEFDKELLKVYETFLKRKYFIDKKAKFINEELYINILQLSLRLNKYNWCINFIKYYSKHLHPQKKKNILNLSYAEYFFQIGSIGKTEKYLNKAFNHLKEIKEESFIIKYNLRSLYVMVYYDLGYYDEVIFQLTNYKKFLIRNSLVTQERKKRIFDFTNLVEKFVYIKEGDSRINISDLHSRILSDKNLIRRDWLLNKIHEIEKLL